MRKKIDITGNTYAALTVVGEVGRSASGEVVWLCRCDCGKDVEVTGSNLRTGNTGSCGCLSLSWRSEKIKTHGNSSSGSVSPTYASWAGAKNRCHNPSSPKYPSYGGRGIKICDRWSESFASFLEDMGERPAGTSLDRINNDGNYEPGNCRWATPKEQSNNRRERIDSRKPKVLEV